MGFSTSLWRREDLLNRWYIIYCNAVLTLTFSFVSLFGFLELWGLFLKSLDLSFDALCRSGWPLKYSKTGAFRDLGYCFLVYGLLAIYIKVQGSPYCDTYLNIAPSLTFLLRFCFECCVLLKQLHSFRAILQNGPDKHSLITFAGISMKNEVLPTFCSILALNVLLMCCYASGPLPHVEITRA